LAYQQQITDLPRGLEVTLNGVRFDGCIEADGTMLEAKGPGFADMMDGPDDWQEWFTGVAPIEAQMQSQSRTAIGRTVEWHFAEEPVADFFRSYAEKYRLSNIRVIYTSPR
jgi:filamentous hemagglutinin